jgi:23S rRNA (uracil1939-C5)-methyltransferase
MQLHYKEIFLCETLNRIAHLTDVPVLPVIGCTEPFFYRNKLEFAFSDQRWLTDAERHGIDTTVTRNALGFHMAGRFDRVLHITQCYLQPEPSNAIRNFVFRYANEKGLRFFNIKKKQGLLRNLIIRTTTTGEVMVILGFFYDAEKEIVAIMNALKEAFPSITSLNYAIINGASDVIYPYEIVCYHGNPYITEQLGHLQLKIGPKSFFQTNSRQAKALYDVVVNFAALEGSETVYDLYAGIGSISLYLAHRSSKVVGIEQVPEAVTDAAKNALHNKITNCEFFAGDVREVLCRDLLNQHGMPDLVITDPPRAGMHAEVVHTLIEMKVPKIIYVSCNPVTQARDLQLLSDVYHVAKVQPVDMFPQTYHIESVALLYLRNS